MRKNTLFLFLLALFIVPFVVMAQTDTGDAKLEAMHKSMMMRPMMVKSIVATSDGGVVVMAGSQLLKYDKDLNFVKKVELKVDMGDVEKQMQEMCPKCAAMKQKMRGMMEMKAGSAASEEKAATETKQTP